MDPNKSKAKTKTVFIKTDQLSVAMDIESVPHMKERIVIFQKYIANPLLYDGRKFDFRVWVLVDHQLNYYLFKEGYLRLSSE
jgi:tubulin--tyrosine ligase/tubulin polyglutamylase TTLL9